jgi:hypothetical protein
VNLANKIELDGWLRPLAAAAGRLRDMTPAYREVGEIMLNRVRSNFLESRGQAPWEELAPSTLLARARGVSGKGRVFKSGKSVGPASRSEHRLLEHAESATDHFRRTQLGHDVSRTLTKGARARVENAKPLIWTGRLLRANYLRVSSTFAEVYNSLVQAKRLFYGWKGAGPQTPSRNPYFFPEEDRRKARDVFKRWIFAPLMGGG